MLHLVSSLEQSCLVSKLCCWSLCAWYSQHRESIEQARPPSSPHPTQRLTRTQWDKAVVVLLFSRSVVSDSCVTPGTVAHQPPLSMGFPQARILEWVAVSFSKGSSGPRDRTWVFCTGGWILYHRRVMRHTQIKYPGSRQGRDSTACVAVESMCDLS